MRLTIRHRNYVVVAAGIVLALLLSGSSTEQEAQGPMAAAPAPSVDCQVDSAGGTLAGVPEASGVAASRRTEGMLWVNGDGPEPVVYAVSVAGEPAGQVKIRGAGTKDWEAVAVAECDAGSCLYVADIGDNGGKRKSIAVYRVTEPLPTDSESAVAQVFHAEYPDGAQDAEAMWVTDRREVYIVTKGETKSVSVYRFPKTARNKHTSKLEKIVSLADKDPKRRDMVTDAGISPDGKWVVLRTSSALLFYPSAGLAAGKAGEPSRFDLASLKEPQGEGVALLDDGTVYLVGEGGSPTKPSTFAVLKCDLTPVPSP